MNTQSITHPTGKYNPAGMTKVYWCLASEIATFPVLDLPETVGADYSSLVTYDAAITMKSTKLFRELYCTVEEGEIKSTVVGSRDGKGKENSLEISFPGNDAAYLGFEAIALNEQFVFIVKEKNGVLRVLGSLEDPAYLDSGDATSGKKIADSRKNVLTFKGSGATAAPIYGVAITSLLTAAV
jgi:hypothetical protein